jgi:protein-L-isoaspartate(D-aspartate) O-methyltransferase
MAITDTYRHKGLRKELVELLRQKGISDENVLAAIEAIPRHAFFDKAFMEHAYEDKAFQIGDGQTISQPYTVAYQSEMLQLERGMKVLEVGTGSGYQAAVLAEMKVKVFSIERFRSLYNRSKAMLQDLGYHTVKTFFGDGFAGLPAYAPFDRILITAAAPEVPSTLLEQLKTGGIMVVPLGRGDDQTMLRISKTGENRFETVEGETFRFVPMLPGKVF